MYGEGVGMYGEGVGMYGEGVGMYGGYGERVGIVRDWL